MATTKKHAAAKKEQTSISADESMIKSTPASAGPNWLLIAFVGALILIGAWYFTQQKGGAPMPSPGPTNGTVVAPDTLTSPSAVALLSSFDKLQSLPNSYNLSFDRPVEGIDANISLMQNGKDRVAVMTTDFDRRAYYWIGNQTVACEWTPGVDQKCAEVSDQQSLMTYGSQLNNSFPTAGDSGSQKALQVKMIELGALHFSAAPAPQTVAGRACTDLTYSMDFASLTPSQLAQLGMTPNDAAVTVFRNFRVEKCLDNELGIALTSHLQYDYVDPRTGQKVPLEDKLAYQTFVTPLTGNLSAPALNANSTDVLSLMTTVNGMLSNVANCQNAPNATAHDQCVRTAAVGAGRADLCRLATDPAMAGQCVTIVAVTTDNPETCKMAGAQTDECYANIAVSRTDSSYCKMIANRDVAQKCLVAVLQAQVGNASAPADNSTAHATAPAPANATAPASNASGSNQTGNSSAARQAMGIY